MTQADLLTTVAPSYRERLAAYLVAREGMWIDGLELANVGGVYAYRTRISECRRVLGLTIHNRLRKVGDLTVSEYRYVRHAESKVA